MLAEAGARRCVVARAQTFLRDWHSFSHPVALSCDDGNAYVVKGRQIGPPVVTEQVVALLGMSLGAPVGPPVLIDVPQALIDVEPRLAFLPAGVAHGNLFRTGWSERAWIDHQNLQENRPRFALLAVLYGWAQAYDHQLIYPNLPPHLVLSVDHGHFLVGGAAWRRASLAGAPPAQLDDSLVSGCGLTSAELNDALARLSGVTEAHIIAAVATPPDEWGTTLDERVALVEYFIRRQQDLLSLVPLT